MSDAKKDEKEKDKEEPARRVGDTIPAAELPHAQADDAEEGEATDETVPGGVYIVEGHYVNAHGNPVTKDGEPSDEPVPAEQPKMASRKGRKKGGK